MAIGQATPGVTAVFFSSYAFLAGLSQAGMIILQFIDG
jgi:hypothetical protein